MAEYVDQQALADRASEIEKLKRVTEMVRAKQLDEFSEKARLGDVEAKKRIDQFAQLRPWHLADDFAQQAEQFGNAELAKQYRELADFSIREASKDQAAAERDQFESSRGSFSGVLTDVLAPIYRGADSFARTASFGASDVAKAAARRLAQAAGGPTVEESEGAERALLDEAARTGFGKVAAGAAEAYGMVRGFGGKGMTGGAAPRLGYSGAMGATEKAADAMIGKGGARELIARVIGSNAGSFVASNAMIQLGEAGAAALNDALYGDSAYRPDAVEILKSMPQGALNSAIIGATIPVLQRIGRGVSSTLAGKWAPGAQFGRSLSELPWRQQLGARGAQAAGGAIEFLGFTALPHVSDDGIAILKPWLDVFSADKARRENGLVEILSQFVAGGMIGAAHGKYMGGPETVESSRGMLMRRKPKLPTNVEQAVRSSTREAVVEMMKNADGERDVMASLLNVVRAREVLGYEKPGTWEKLAEAVDADWGAKEKKQFDDKMQEALATDEKREKKRIDKAKPLDLGFIEPGMGLVDPADAKMLGMLPFMVDAEGRRSSPTSPGSWPADTRRDLADAGTEIVLNVGKTGKGAIWMPGRVVRPVFYGTGEREGQLKGVLVQTESGLAMFTGNHIRKGLVKMADSSSMVDPSVGPETAASPPRKPRPFGEGQREDAYGQRFLPFGKDVKPGKTKPPPPELGATPGARGETDVLGTSPVSERPIGGALGSAPKVKKVAMPAPAAKPKSAEAAADAAVKAAEPRIARAVPLLARPKLGAGAGERGTDRRKQLVPVAVDRRAQAQKTRRAILEGRQDDLTKLKNKRGYDEALAAIPGRGLVISRIDGTNMKASNDESVGGHANGDKVLKAFADRIKKAAVEAGIRETSVFRIGGDEFSVIGTPAQIAKMRRILDADNKVGESVVGGVKYEHRVIAGKGKATDKEADTSQSTFHENYKKQAEAAGLGVYRKAAEAKPAAPAPAKKSNAPFIREAKVAEAKKRLRGSGFDVDTITSSNLYHLQAADAGKIYKNGWKKVTWNDVLEARASGDLDRITFAENAAKIAGVTAPAAETRSPAPKVDASPSAEAEGKQGSTTPNHLWVEESIRGLYDEPNMTAKDRDAELKAIEDVIGKDARERIEHMLSMGESADTIISDQKIAGLIRNAAVVEGATEAASAPVASPTIKDREPGDYSPSTFPVDFNEATSIFLRLARDIEAANKTGSTGKRPDVLAILNDLTMQVVGERPEPPRTWYDEVMLPEMRDQLRGKVVSNDPADAWKGEYSPDEGGPSPERAEVDRIATEKYERDIAIWSRRFEEMKSKIKSTAFAAMNDKPKKAVAMPAQEPLLKQMGPTADYISALRDANIPVSRIESELDYLRAQVRNAEERNDTVESEKWTRVLDTVARIVAKRGGSVPTPEPLKRVATEPGLTTGTEIAERALRNHRNDLAVMRAAYDQEAARTGKPITQEQQDRISAAEATIRDLTKLARLVKKRGARMPYEAAPTAAPKPGDNVVIRLDNGRAVAGVVLKSQAVSKAEVEGGEEIGFGRRILVLKADGNIERVRVSEVADIAPADVLNHDFTKPVDVSLETFTSWFAGRDAMETEAYKGSMDRSSDFSEDARSVTVERRKSLLRGGGTAKDAEREAKARSRRIRYDKLNSDDFELEALAMLAPPNARKEMEATLTADAQGRDVLRRTRKDALSDSLAKAIVRWFDPDAKLRTEKELEEAAATDTRAAEDLAAYRFFKSRADAERGLEMIRDNQSKSLSRLGRGFAVVHGDLADIADRPVIIRQQGYGSSGDWGKPTLLRAQMGNEGRITIRELTEAEAYLAQQRSPEIRETLLRMAEGRRGDALKRMTEDERLAVIGWAGERAMEALKQAHDFIRGLRDDLPGNNELFDAAREWLRQNPRPRKTASGYSDWIKSLAAELKVDYTGSSHRDASRSIVQKKAAVFDSEGKAVKDVEGKKRFDETPRTLGQIAGDAARLGRDVLSGKQMKYQDGEVVPHIESDLSGVVVPSAFPGMPPPGSWRHAKRLASVVRKPLAAAGRFATDVSEAVASSVLREMQNLVFRPDRLGIAHSPAGDSDLFKKWVRTARTFEANASPAGDEFNARMLTYLNRGEGEESAYIERMERALKPFSELKRERQIEVIRDYTLGKKPKELVEYDTFMREMHKELVRLGFIPEGPAGERFLGQYVHYGRFALTDAQLREKKAELKSQLEQAIVAGDDVAARRATEGLENLETIRTRSSGDVGPTRVVISPMPLAQLSDPATTHLLKGGYTRRRSFESFDDAIKHGLDISSPIELLKGGMFSEMLAVTRHRMFEAIAADTDMVKDPRSGDQIPSWYVKVDPSRTSKLSSWRKLDGKLVNPALLDQLYQMEAEGSPITRLLDYVHSSLKMSRALVDPGAVFTNLVGNPMILVANGMNVGDAMSSYIKAFTQLVLVDPALRPVFGHGPGMKAIEAAARGEYGSRRDQYMKEGWVTHASDVTRELMTALNKDRRLYQFLLRGYTDPSKIETSDSLFRAFRATIESLGEKAVRFYNLIDAAARVALHEHNISKGMGYEQSVREVNKSFDVKHLPKLWRGLRTGAGGLGAFSFASFSVAMARNASKFIGASPWVLANLAAVSMAARLAMQAMYGQTDEEFESQIDASLPRTGSVWFDKLNRITAIPLPLGDGRWGTQSVVKFTPHDAMMDLVPGVRPFLLGGRDDRGRTPIDAPYDALTRSVAAAPYVEWFFDKDAQSGAPVRERYDSLNQFVGERFGATIPGTPVPLVLPKPFQGLGATSAMVQRKANLFNRAVGSEPRYTARVPFIKVKDGRNTIPGATAEPYGLAEAMWNMIGLRPSEPNAIRRALENASANDERVVLRRGSFRPDIDRGAPGRRGARDTAKELEALRDAEKGLRLWAAVMELDRLVATRGSEDRIEGVKKQIAKMATNSTVVDSLRSALLDVGERSKANDLMMKMRALGVYPEREPRIQRGRGGSILPE